MNPTAKASTEKALTEEEALHWDQLQTLFGLAEALPHHEREDFLTSHCADPQLRQRVLALLRASQRESCAPAAFAPTQTPNTLLTAVGPYTVLRQLGMGGMGAVYLVERHMGGVTQRAALKMLLPHLTGPLFLERFEREQRILASLDHPSITRMLEAGFSDNAEPYLVMEYVDGQPLDRWCDDRRLGVNDRLRLFQEVCAAVDYAHRNLVVHLDLKPSNILVTGNARPKVLDFGTSKLVQPDGQITATLPVTPSYASPEQLRNGAITTASDIYSLGVILFELLAGRRPRGEASLAAAIEHALAEQEPDFPDRFITQRAAENRGVSESRLRALIVGDLSTIVRKCLRPRPSDRYPSVQQLSDDIGRYLESRPVLARPQSALDHVAKFVRRNRIAVAAGAAMFAALAALIGYSLITQRRALEEGQRAQRMQAFLYRLFKTANSNFAGQPNPSVRDFLQLGLKVLPSYIHDPSDLRQARLALGESIFWNGDLAAAERVYSQVQQSAVQAHDVAAEAEAAAYLGDIARQQSNYEAALSRTARALELSRTPGVPPRTRVLAAGSYALVRENLGQRTEENLNLWKFAVKESRDHALPPHEIGEATAYLASALSARGRLAEAEISYREALRLYRQDPLAMCNQASVLAGLAGVRMSQAHEAESVPLYREAYDASLRCAGPQDLGTIEMAAFWAGSLVRSGSWREALPMLENSAPGWRKAYPRYGDPNLFLELSYLTFAYLEAGRYSDAGRIAEEILVMVRNLKGKLPLNDRRVGLAQWATAWALAGQSRFAESLPHAREAYAILSSSAATPLASKDAARAHELLAQVLAATR